MNIKSEINIIQKRLLERLNVKTGSTLYIIIQEISRQAFAKHSFVVSQKNSTLATKCNVTSSTISRNLKKLKDKCSDLITIEQNRNTEEKFAALIFTFNCEKNSQFNYDNVSQLENQCQTVESNGGQSVSVITDNESFETAEITSSLYSTNPKVYIKNHNKDLNTNIVNSVDHSKINHEIYIEYKQKGIDKALYLKVLNEVKNKQGIRNYKAYLKGILNKIVGHLANRKSDTKSFPIRSNDTHYNLNNLKWHYDWIGE